MPLNWNTDRTEKSSSGNSGNSGRLIHESVLESDEIEWKKKHADLISVIQLWLCPCAVLYMNDDQPFRLFPLIEFNL